jgi:predicted DNA-binding transcriptional regulator AlpA
MYMSQNLNVDDILGTAEVAEVLEVSKQRVQSLRQMREFPDPVKVLASTPIWDRADIIKFLSVWRPWKVQQ